MTESAYPTGYQLTAALKDTRSEGLYAQTFVLPSPERHFPMSEQAPRRFRATRVTNIRLISFSTAAAALDSRRQSEAYCLSKPIA
jgi:hypothetical protein